VAITGLSVRTALNARLNRAEIADAINASITLAINDIARLALWPDLHTTDTTTLAFTAGDKSKALPADFLVLDRLYIADDRSLVVARVDEIRRRQESDLAGDAEPVWYAIQGGEVFVWPIPDAAYTVACDYWAVVALITDETVALPLGDEFLEAIIAGTIVAYLKSVGLNVHPKMAENQAIYGREIALLLPGEDRKVTIAQPCTYVTIAQPCTY